MKLYSNYSNVIVPILPRNKTYYSIVSIVIEKNGDEKEAIDEQKNNQHHACVCYVEGYGDDTATEEELEESRKRCRNSSVYISCKYMEKVIQKSSPRKSFSGVVISSSGLPKGKE